MKKLILLLSLISVNAFATAELDRFFHSNEAMKQCQKALVKNGNYTYKRLKSIFHGEDKVYFVQYKNHLSTIAIYDLLSGDKRELQFEGLIEDIVVKTEGAYILGQRELYLLDKDTDAIIFKMRTLPQRMTYNKNSLARGLYIDESHLYIAHGTVGVLVYKKINNQFVKVIAPKLPQPNTSHISKVTDVEGLNGKLYFTYDDVTLAHDSKAFEGLAIWNLGNDSLETLVPVNQRKEAYYKSNLTINDDELIISNLHLNFRHRLNNVATYGHMSPFDRIWKYDDGELIGRSLIVDKKFYGCFSDMNYDNLKSGFTKFANK